MRFFRAHFALLFLGVFFVVGMLEVFALGSGVVTRWVLERADVAKQPTCHVALASAHAACCATECPNTGDCDCGKPKRVRPEGMVFFAAPGCHPNDDGFAVFSPATMGFHFLRPVHGVQIAFGEASDSNHVPSDLPVLDWRGSPAVPPPRGIS